MSDKTVQAFDQNTGLYCLIDVPSGDILRRGRTPFRDGGGTIVPEIEPFVRETPSFECGEEDPLGDYR